MSAPLCKYHLLREIGRGSFGVVYEARVSLTDQIVAVKRSRCSEPVTVESALQEFWALRSIKSQHQNVLRMEECLLQTGTDPTSIHPVTHKLGSPSYLLLVETSLKGRRPCAGETAIYLWFVTEYCESGNLNDYLVTHRPDPCLHRRFMQQLASAISFLHSNQIVHRDLKPENILVSQGALGPELKVADFGLSKICQGNINVYQHHFSSDCGSPFYMAPEAFEGHYTAKADIFSLGIIFWVMIEMLTFMDDDKEILGVYISQGKDLICVGEALLENPNLELQIPMKNKKSMPNEVRVLILDMLALNVKDRLDACELEERIEQLSYGENRQRVAA